MSKRNRWLAVAVMSVLCLGPWCAGQADEPKKPAGQEAARQDPTQKNVWTRKLEHAQKLLAAVAQNDSTKVTENAEQLIKISQELAWKRIRSEKYEELSKEYRREAEYLIKASKAKNTEAMALGYVKMSLACFNCHNHVREVLIAER